MTIVIARTRAIVAALLVAVIMTKSTKLHIPTISNTALSNSGTTSTSTPTTPVDNKKEEPIGPIDICSIGIKSACNGPAFDHP
jgi:hypothetical protein